MPFLIEHISEAVLALNIAVLLAAAALIVAAFLRRRRREAYFRRIDALREHFAPIISGVMEGSVDHADGLRKLDELPGKDRLQMLEMLLVGSKPLPSSLPMRRRLCEYLGLVAVWQEQLAGAPGIRRGTKAEGQSRATPKGTGSLGFLARAASANYLGIILHQPSWPLLARALNDKHPDVASVAARSLAAIGEPESFDHLLHCLHRIVLSNSQQISLRSIKMALVSFPIVHVGKLLPSLQHSNRRIRFLAVDIIREMAETAAANDPEFSLHPANFSPDLAELFLNRLNVDENPDVRARSAPVIAYMSESRAISALLMLLGDKEWFVRLHAARSLAKPKFSSRAHFIASRLSDSNWMVREAATKTLFSFGPEGMSQLYDHVLSTTDRYSKEQIADEMQRLGLIPSLLEQYAMNSGGKEGQVLEQLADLGKTSYMLEILRQSDERQLRTMFLANFGRHQDPQIRTWVKDLASGAPFTKIRRERQRPDATAPQPGRA